MRLKYQDLDPNLSYVVYSNDPAASAVADFLLSARGLTTRYVDAVVRLPEPEQTDVLGAPGLSIKSVLSNREEAPMSPSTSIEPKRSEDITEIEPAEPEFYTQTQSGQGLAKLVEEIRSGHEQIESETVQDPTEVTVTGTSHTSLDHTYFGLDLDSL